jgi:hypothetical protein
MDPLEPMLRIDPAEPASRRERSSFRMKLFSQPGRSPQEAVALPIPRAKLICQPKHTGEDRSSIPALGWCRIIGGLWVGVILSEHHARAA